MINEVAAPRAERFHYFRGVDDASKCLFSKKKLEGQVQQNKGRDSSSFSSTRVGNTGTSLAFRVSCRTRGAYGSAAWTSAEGALYTSLGQRPRKVAV